MEKKNLGIIYVLQTLIKYSDNNHYLHQQEISDLIYKDYGIHIERKTIASHLSSLIDLGYDILRGQGKNSNGKGFALYERPISNIDAKIINDAIFSSRSITGKQAIELSNKLSNLMSIYQNKDYGYLYKSTEIPRTTNDEVFLNIETIEDAIKQNKRITFAYYQYDIKGNLVNKKGDFRFGVSPYYLVNNFGKYYLLCNYRTGPNYHNLVTFRIDYMKDVKIDEKRDIKPLNIFDDLKDFDISKYLNEHLYLFNSNVIEAKYQLLNDESIHYIDDWFGKDKIKLSHDDNNYYVTIKCDEDSLLYWTLQYGNHVKLISPSSLKTKIISYLEDEIHKYKGAQL